MANTLLATCIGNHVWPLGEVLGGLDIAVNDYGGGAPTSQLIANHSLLILASFLDRRNWLCATIPTLGPLAACHNFAVKFLPISAGSKVPKAAERPCSVLHAILVPECRWFKTAQLMAPLLVTDALSSTPKGVTSGSLRVAEQISA